MALRRESRTRARRCPSPAALLAVLAALPLLLAGCSGLTDDPAVSSVSPTPSTAPTLDPGVPVLPSASVSPTVGTGEGPVLVLRGDGLALYEGDVEVQPLPFGSPADAVRQVLEETLGATTPAELPDCAQGPRGALLVAGVTALLDAGAFVGWRDGGGDESALATAEGLGVGARLDELQSLLPDVQIGPGVDGLPVWSSPGTGLSGELSDPGPEAAVTVLTGGQVCGPR